MASRSTIATLAAQIAELSQRVDTLATQCKPTKASLSILDWRVPNGPTDFVTTMHAFSGVVSWLIAGYYLTFGLIYTNSGIAILQIGTIALAHITPLRIIIGLAYLIVGAGIFSCIAHPTERWQNVMVWPTVAVAVIAGVLSALPPAPPLTIIRSSLFWLGIIAIHLAFGNTIHYRIALHDLTTGLAIAEEARVVP